MASKDFIYDIMDKLEEEGQEYILITPTQRKKEVVVDVNFSLNYEDTVTASISVLKKVAQKLEEEPPEDFDGEEWIIEEE
tara:strand:+ start:911 stop:1150 length:240 start_codon:yes stop_codon:yes gene_type:complete